MDANSQVSKVLQGLRSYPGSNGYRTVARFAIVHERS